ncbi:MAG: carboxypeptidase regulatory-like domain-containing protein [Bacteroidales bacterium]|nr:carboxypeptidase regulatory-like domain-containing protein [Bacteroidales bacterium]
MKKYFTLALLLLISWGLTAQKTNLNQLMQERNEYYFTFELNGNDNLKAIAQTISVDRVDGNVVTAYANNKEFAEFQKMGYEITLQTPPSMLFEAEMWDGNNRAAYDWDQYPTYEAYENMMYQFATDHPDKCEILTLGTLPSNRKILVAHINNGSGAGKPKFLYTSTIHGDETTGWMLMLRMIDYILENPTLPECANVLENIDLYVGPNTNPDGTYHGGNSNVNGATRYNANGVDMNRNYADPHGSAHPDGNAYAQETEWFMQLAQDNNFVMGANYHGGEEVMNYPWDNTYTLHADDQWYQLISHEYADLCHAVSSSYMTAYNNGVTNGAQWYMIGGGRQDYMNGYAECRELTIECSSTKCPPASQMPNFWNINKNAIFAYMNQCLNGIHGTVVDAESKAPIGGALITLVGHDDQYSTVSTQLPGGDFHRPVKAGTYNVRITKNGYEPYETQVTVADNETVNIEAQMVALEGIVADFTVNVTAINVGGVVHFTDNSWGAQITDYAWVFEGGTPATSSELNPVVTYNQAGTFDVSLTVTNADGETDTKYMPDLINVVSAFNMHQGQEYTCSSLFYDDGGYTYSYQNNLNMTLTIYPDTEFGIIEVIFQSFEMEQNYDFLYIYDGVDTNAPQIGVYTGTSSPGTVTATNYLGALTFKCTSDSSVTKDGWEAFVHCIGVSEPMLVSIELENDTVILGNSMVLRAIVSGGDGDYTYYWDDPYGCLDDINSAEPVFTPTEAGIFNYTVTVYDGAGNMDYAVASIVVIDTQSVNESLMEHVHIYPNPTDGILHVEGIKGVTMYRLINSMGQTLVEGQSESDLTINAKQFGQGVYFLHLNGTDGNKIEKVIIK